MKEFKNLTAIREFQSLKPPKVSFEFFPPKTPEMEKTLWETIKALETLQPAFVSVTYGAGGSTREKTHQTVARIKKDTTLTPAAHLTCVGATKEEIDNVAQNYWDAGIRHIVALRGDPPNGIAKYSPHPGGYPYCVDLVKGLKKIGDFEISVACFPETHPDAISPDADIDYLKKKIDAGATRAITQYFFDPELYFSFLDKARKKGIKVPIIPGIILFASYAQLIKFSNMCQATVPQWLHNILQDTDDVPGANNILAGIVASEQCRILREAGVDQFHFYTLNRPATAISVCSILGIKPKKG